MYAVVNSGGKQYKVRQGDVLRVEKLPGEVGAPVSFDKVLLFSDGENLEIGQPLLDGMQVTGHIVEQDKARKILVFKYKRRKRYRRKQGHRQPYTAVKIDQIGSGGGLKAKSEPAQAEEDIPQVTETDQEIAPDMTTRTSEPSDIPQETQTDQEPSPDETKRENEE